jgi:hypothetical protein
MSNSVTFKSSAPVEAFSVLAANTYDDNQFDINAEIEYQIEYLSAEAINWNEYVYKSAHQQLYAILFRIRDFLKTLTEYEPDPKKLRSTIKEIAQKKVAKKFKSSTSCIYMLVCCVFASIPAKRSSTYALALQSIVDQHGDNLTEAEFIELVEEAGGIYELAKPVEAKNVAKAGDLSAAAVNEADEKVEGELLCFKNKQFSELLKEPDTAYIVVIMKNDKGQLSVYAVRDFEQGVSGVTIPALPQ